MFVFSLILFLFYLKIYISARFEHCRDADSVSDRILHIVTCETGGHSLGWMKNDSLLAWNVTSRILRRQSVSMVNTCEGKAWEHKLLTKPLSFLEYTNHLLDKYPTNIRERVHVILMDSDTYWSVNGLNDVWNRYDCARNGKDMVVSTETACWMGFYCTANDIKQWYSNLSSTPTYSPFANSGVYMGKLTLVNEMLRYIVANNNTYFTYDTTHKVMKFHDQHAVADYSIRIAPHRIQLDYHQQFAATFAVRVSVGKNANKQSTAVCKRRDGSLDYHCADITSKLSSAKLSYFRVNETDCRTYRDMGLISTSMPHYNELESIAPYPIVWHGNGAAKKSFLAYSQMAYRCHQRKFKRLTIKNSMQ